MKRGQISATPFFYVLTIVIVAFILFMGYRYVSFSRERSEKVNTLILSNSIASDIKTISPDYGRIKKASYAAKVDELCLVDLSRKNEILSSELISSYPLIKDSISSGANKNAFVFGQNAFEPSFIGDIEIRHYPYFKCLKPAGNTLSFGLEGTGSKALVLTEFVAEAKIDSNKKTELESTDGIVTLVVPENTQASSDSISIEIVEPGTFQSQNKASDVYKFGPSGTTFTQPILLKVKFSPAVVGECPKSLNFRHYNDDGSLKEVIPSKEIDCTNKIATFEIDSFSQGFIGDGTSGSSQEQAAVQQPIGQETIKCKLTKAYWEKTSAVENEIVLLIVEGGDCNGKQASFVVEEIDPIGNDPANTNPGAATFKDGKATASWTAEWQDDWTGNPEYGFTATAEGESIVSSNEFSVSKAAQGPVCGNNIVEAGEECDGSAFGAVKQCADIAGFAEGALKCSNCRLDASQCTAKATTEQLPPPQPLQPQPEAKAGRFWMHHVRRGSYNVDVGFKPESVSLKVTIYDCITNDMCSQYADSSWTGLCTDPQWSQHCGSAAQCSSSVNVLLTGSSKCSYKGANQDGACITSTQSCPAGCDNEGNCQKSPSSYGASSGLAYGYDARYSADISLNGIAKLTDNGFTVTIPDDGWGGKPIIVEYVASPPKATNAARFWMDTVIRNSKSIDLGFKPKALTVTVQMYYTIDNNLKNQFDDAEWQKWVDNIAGRRDFAYDSEHQCIAATTVTAFEGKTCDRLTIPNIASSTYSRVKSEGSKISDASCIQSSRQCSYQGDSAASGGRETVKFGVNLAGWVQLTENGFKIELPDEGLGGFPAMVEYIASPPSATGAAAEAKASRFWMHHVRRGSYTENLGYKPTSVNLFVTAYDCVNNNMCSEFSDSSWTGLCTDPQWSQHCGSAAQCSSSVNVLLTGSSKCSYKGANQDGACITSTQSCPAGCDNEGNCQKSPSSYGASSGLAYGYDARYSADISLNGIAKLTDNGFTVTIPDDGWGGKPIIVEYVTTT